MRDQVIGPLRSQAHEPCQCAGLGINCVQGMTDLPRFAESSFDMVFNPVSITYVDDVQSLWRECRRVLKPRGRLMVGTMNPYSFLFEEDDGVGDEGLVAKYSLPFVEEEDRHATVDS